VNFVAEAPRECIRRIGKSVSILSRCAEDRHPLPTSLRGRAPAGWLGGSTLYFAEVLTLISPRSLVLSVDIDHNQVDETV
jgi:hypothetical protein